MDYSQIAAALGKEIGENDEESTVRQWLDSNFPPLNMASGASWTAGFPVGRIMEIAGPPSAGKTALATEAMIAAQQAGGIAAFMDHERSFSFKLAQKLGLNTQEGAFIYRKPKTFEESVALFKFTCQIIRQKKLIDKDAPICWVFDSLAAMVPKSVLFDSKGKERSAEERNMNDNTALARATSAHFPAVAQVAEDYNVCGIFLNQLRTNIGVMFGDNRKTTGGDAPAFYFSQRLWLSSKKIKDPKTNEIIGAEVTGKYEKNKAARPFATAKWRFMFQPDGTGRFDIERSLVDFLKDNDALTKASRQGYVEFEGKQYTYEQLARHIEETDALDKLKALLPPEYEPEVVATVTTEDEAA